MGCDYIGGDFSCVGISLAYEMVCAGTIFDIDQVESEDRFVERLWSDLLDEAATKEERFRIHTETEAGRDPSKHSPRNLYFALPNSWKVFVAEKYPEIAALGISPIIGCVSMSGSYESCRDVLDCRVVFGYKFEVENVIDPETSNEICQISTRYEFPKNLKSVIAEFVPIFQLQCADEGKKNKNQWRQNRVLDAATMDAPKIVTFVV